MKTVSVRVKVCVLSLCITFYSVYIIIFKLREHIECGLYPNLRCRIFFLTMYIYIIIIIVYKHFWVFISAYGLRKGNNICEIKITNIDVEFSRNLLNRFQYFFPFTVFTVAKLQIDHSPINKNKKCNSFSNFEKKTLIYITIEAI